MNENPHNQVERLQKNLSVLRKVAGWSAEDLAEQLEVTRQTIVNLESGQTRMTKIQYMAIRLVFVTEIESSHNQVLNSLLERLVDKNDISEAEYKKITQTIDEAASRVGRRSGSKAASLAIIAALQATSIFALTVGLAPTIAATLATATTASWVHDIIKGKNSK